MTMTVKERAIPYSGPMMLARRAGIKTMTRRVVKPEPDWEHPFPCPSETPEGWQGPLDYSLWAHEGDQSDGCVRRCPYGQPGDRLWTREAWKTLLEYDHLPPREIPRTAPIWYLADGNAPEGFGRYRHGRFMVRWMSRGLDEITAVRVERLNDISDSDAAREGIFHWEGHGYYDKAPDAGGIFHACAAAAFKTLWESINGPGSWAQNPWVWVIEFKRVA